MRASYFVFLCLIGGQTFSQTYIVLVKSGGNDKWQYIDVAGRVVVPQRFTLPNPFSEDGFAPVYEDGMDYFIDIHGKKLVTQLTDFTLDRNVNVLTGFSGGFAPVKVDGKWGYIDTQGTTAIPVRYDYASGFAGGFAIVRVKNKFFVLNAKGEQFPIADGVRDVRKFSEGMAAFEGVNKKFGFIGTDGKELVAAQFDGVGSFSNGVAWARTESLLIGFIGKNGEWVIQPKYKKVQTFDPESGFARVTVDYNWEYISLSGSVLQVDNTTLFGEFSDGLAVGRKGHLVGFYDNRGVWVIPPRFDVARHFRNGYAGAKLNGKWGVIDKQGKWTVEPKFDAILDVVAVK